MLQTTTGDDAIQVPTLETTRLLVRALTQADELACHELYVDIDWADHNASDAVNRERKHEWLEWTVRNYLQLSELTQPPYGERAVVTKSEGRFIGLVGFEPYWRRSHSSRHYVVDR